MCTEPSIPRTGVHAKSCPPRCGTCFKLPSLLKLTNADPFSAWFVVNGDAETDGIRVVRWVLGAMSYHPANGRPCKVLPAQVSMQSVHLGPVHPSFRAFSGRLTFTVRSHTFNTDLPRTRRRRRPGLERSRRSLSGHNPAKVAAPYPERGRFM